MDWLKRVWVVLIVFLFSVVVWLPTTQAAPSSNSDLIKVMVNLTIENPDYFWKYPFSGSGLDAIRISGMGKTVIVQAASSGQKIEFEVPKDYKFRIYIAFQDSNSTFKEFTYYSKQGVNELKDTLDITLKAPEAQAVIINAPAFEQQHTR